jgi:hypothetical protein
MKRIVTILLLAFLLVAATPQDTSEQQIPNSQKIEQRVIYSQAPYDLRIAKKVGVNPEYRLVGMFVDCDSVLEVRAAFVGNPTDSTSAQFVPIARQFARTKDGCTIEMFAFGFHGGVVRKILEAEGTAEFVVICANGAICFELTAEGEAEILELFKRTKEESI